MFILTGKIQTGKTRWLQRLVEEVEKEGGRCDGVIAPGDWRCVGKDETGLLYEKFGIFNEMLPEHERVLFARRRDLVCADGHPGLQGTVEAGCSSKVEFGWAFRNEAVRCVDERFVRLGETAVGPGILIVDEFGRLELEMGKGLVNALRMVDEGPTNVHPVALVVVREGLLGLAKRRFSGAWGEVREILPDGASFEATMSALGAAGIFPCPWRAPQVADGRLSQLDSLASRI